MVGRIGVNLSFKAEGRTFCKRQSAFADYRAVKEIAGVKLNAGFGGFYLHGDAAFVALGNCYCFKRAVIIGNAEIMVIAHTIYKLRKIIFNILAYSL